MEKKKLAFVDYWHHEFTRSGDFLRNIFNDEFEITNFWWKPKSKFEIKKLEEFEYIFFFHVIFPYQVMKKLSDKNILWAPMYDGLIFKNNFEKKIFWRQISLVGIKVLEFSRKISESIDDEKIDILKLRYFIKPNIEYNSQIKNKLKIFFWDRGQIKIKDWITSFNTEDISEIIYFPLVDPSRKITENLDNYKNIKIKIIEKQFLPKNDYLELIKHCDVFIAPRKKEGIGMSIVEALSKGKYIVGFNEATMDEYISDEKIGFLFGKNSKKINTKNIFYEHNFRKENAEINYKKWLKQKKEIVPFFKKNKNFNKKKLKDIVLIYDSIKFLIKKILNKNRFVY